MTTTLIILAAILALLIVVVFVIGSLRSKGKTFKKYEEVSSGVDKTLREKTECFEGNCGNIKRFCNFNIKEILAWILKMILDLLHIISRKVSIKISKLRNKYHKKSKADDIPSSPSEYLREVGGEKDK